MPLVYDFSSTCVQPEERKQAEQTSKPFIFEGMREVMTPKELLRDVQTLLIFLRSLFLQKSCVSLTHTFFSLSSLSSLLILCRGTVEG